MRNSLFIRVAPALLLALAAHGAQARTLVEYYHAGLDHYFVTGSASEIRDLDSGVHRGWARTGQTLQVFDDGDGRLANSIPVCRFYGNPARGLDSHFYSATPQECTEVQQKFPDDWLLESAEVFRMHPPVAVTGACPAGTTPVYRLYNGRADANHRYTGDTTIVQAMLAKGYTIEGVGSPLPVVFCSAAIAPTPPLPGAPTCQVATSTDFPVLGGFVDLTATCTGIPTSYGWINCNAYGTTCRATSNTAGPVLYGVVATNGSGPGAPATLTLNWQPAATAPPSCTVAASTTAPPVGGLLTLTGTCDAPVARYEWLACAPLSPDACTPVPECRTATTSCTPTATQPGTILYSLRASNNAGTGAKASVTVTWGGGTPPPSGATPTCTLAASSTTPATGSMLTLTASCTESPTAYLWTNCTSTTSVCDTSAFTPGPRTYYVNARNASGVGPAASIVVNWQEPANAPPVCTLSANPAVPYVGSATTLTATCTQSPSSYAWTGCTGATGNTCVATSATTGPAAYSVTATNAFGTSAPASITLDWQQPPVTGPDLCAAYPKVKRIDLVWGGFKDTNDPGGGFEADAVLVGRIRVPASATGTSIPGLVSVAEYVDSPADRVFTLSPSACDFRGFQPGVFPAVDPSGATAPLAWSFGIAPSTQIALTGMASSAPKLVPGQDYFVNVQNRRFGDGLISCATTECNVRVTVNAPR